MEEKLIEVDESFVKVQKIIGEALQPSEVDWETPSGVDAKILELLEERLRNKTINLGEMRLLREMKGAAEHVKKRKPKHPVNDYDLERLKAHKGEK